MEPACCGCPWHSGPGCPVQASVSLSELGLWPIPCLSKANSAKVQEDLEAEFQSLFSLLEELKEGMLMKIKQDRASRTYELQVCQGASPAPPPRCYRHGTPPDSAEPH